eukprot:6192213-Pleurochrysis_carterae.AAC.5
MLFRLPTESGMVTPWASTPPTATKARPSQCHVDGGNSLAKFVASARSRTPALLVASTRLRAQHELQSST